MDVPAWLRKFELDFGYTNPVDTSLSANKGMPILFGNGVRIVLRPAGTGTAGATLGVCLETWEPDAKHEAARRAPIWMADQLTGIRACTVRETLSLVA